MHMIRSALAAIEPWYDWGTIHVERLQELRLVDGNIESGGEGPVRYAVLQWFGIHLAVQVGRTPLAARLHR